MTVIRAVLYTRLSESDEASTSLARQEADLRALADREGWTVTEVLADDGLSGGKDRVKADRALDLLRSGAADVLAVWKLDRWSRQGIGTVARLMDVLEERPEALFVADRDGIRSDQAGWRLTAAVLSEVARTERENTQVRVRSAIKRMRREGRFPGGNVPYGYRTAAAPDGPGRVLEIDPDEAAVVREAASRAIAGESLYAISKDFGRRGLKPRRAKEWSISSLQVVLTSEPVVGRLTKVSHVTEGGRTRRVRDVVRDDDGNPVQMWPPVLDLETWHRVRARFSARGENAVAPRRRRARLLSGIVTCGLCGRPLYVRTNARQDLAYACSAGSQGKSCPGVSISCPHLEDYVTEQFLADVGPAEVVDRVVEAPDDADAAEVEASIAATTRQMGDDDADVEALSKRLAALKERRAVIRSRPRERRVRIVPTGRTFAEEWEDGDLVRRRELLEANTAVMAIAKGKKGRKTFDPSRVTWVTTPPHPADAEHPNALTSPRRVV
ncbi:recombinase family protein [Aquipuribacter sp. SD81]|uniref:recombinase family protein n=1 Tax=Aquipuribacter sp. SD81 TaxID=3127703 RepID=UPI00301992F0